MEVKSMFTLHETYKAVSGSTDPAITAGLAVILAACVVLLIWAIIEVRK